MDSLLSHLECGNCLERHQADRLHNTCLACGGPLLAKYRLGESGVPTLDEVLARRAGQFRFHELLPTRAGASTPTLGEGATPLVATPGLGPNVWVKDESQNPTGSFKARGMAVAVAKNVELGASAICLPSNGNAGGAAAAYGALHGVPVDVAMPANTPRPLVLEAEALGASVTLVDGTIADAGEIQAEKARSGDWFSLATLKEPYRVEGKKVMGYEIFWDLGHLPEVIVYPTGGGTGLVGMVKAFDEMGELGWIGAQRPRMVAVQVSGCAPIVQAFHSGANEAGVWDNADETSAFGLRVPSAIGDRLMLEGLRSSDGTAVAVSEGEMLRATARLAKDAGIWGSPEGGACLAALEHLRDEGWITPTAEVVLFNTGAATKYL